MNIFEFLIKEDLQNDFITALSDWKRDLLIESLEDILNKVPKEIMSEFIFKGIAYRGLVVDINLNCLEDKKLSSWTTNPDICEDFWYKDGYIEWLIEEEGYEKTKGIIISAEIEGILIDKIMEKSFSYKDKISPEIFQRMESDIDNLFEAEILAPFSIKNYTIVDEVEH